MIDLSLLQPAAEVCRRAVHKRHAFVDARSNQIPDEGVELRVLPTLLANGQVRDDQGRTVVAIARVEDSRQELRLERCRVGGNVVETQDVDAGQVGGDLGFGRSGFVRVGVLNGALTVGAGASLPVGVVPCFLDLCPFLAQ